MSDEAKVRELLAPMQDIPVDIEGRRFTVDRAKVVAIILEAPAAREAARAARWRRRALVCVLAAGFAVAAGATGWVRARRSNGPLVASRTLEIDDVRGEVALLDRGSRTAVVAGATSPVPAEGELVTGLDSRASVHTRDGLEVQLFENSRVALSDLGIGQPAMAIRLDHGSIRCRVPRLLEGRHFSVVTPSATVVVHGTIFQVEVAPMAGATQTCVRVEEGVVTVIGASGEARLEALQSWGCNARRGEPEKAVPAPSSQSVGKGGPIPVESVAKTGLGAPPRINTDPPRPTAGTLNEQNRLFQAGLAAERNGDARGAAASFDLLLSRYPQSPLADDARSALARVAASAKGPR